MSSFPLNNGVPPAIARTRHPVFAAGQPEADWPEMDVSILEEKRGIVPPFPLDLLAQPWRDWVSDTASSAGAPTDYVAQAVLAALAGLCGAGVAVRITPVWSEPLCCGRRWSANRPAASHPRSPRCAGCSARSRPSVVCTMT